MARQSVVKRGTLWLHRWLGIVLALLFAMWFFSGVVMYFVPYPALTDSERLAASPPLQLVPDCCLSAESVTRQAGFILVQARFDNYAGRPVWRVLAKKENSSIEERPAWIMLDAITGERFPPLDAAQAEQVATRFSQRDVVQVEEAIIDNWTLAGRSVAYRPLFKVTMGADRNDDPNSNDLNNDGDRLDDGSLDDESPDDDGLVLYVSANTAEVVLDTRRTERFWNWVGTIPHWLYLVSLRQSGLWVDVVIWLSGAGVVAAVTGLVLGVWQLFLNPRRLIPYKVFWLRLHHLLGLAAGIFTFTWIFSGLMSMNPAGVFGERGAGSGDEAQRWQGSISDPVLSVPEVLNAVQAQGFTAKELGTVRIAGQLWYAMRNDEHFIWLRDSAQVIADPASNPVLTRLPDTLITHTLKQLRPAAGEPELRLITEYDHFYYNGHDSEDARRWLKPLPVWRAQWGDDVVIYADPHSGQIRLRVDDTRRWQRVLYHGLHCLDFAPLLERPWLRNSLVVGLSILGFALSVTSCVIASQYFQRRSKVRGRRAPQGSPRHSAGSI